MYVDKAQRKNLRHCPSDSTGTGQMSFLKDNRTSQMSENARICQMQAMIGTRTLGLSGRSGSGSSGLSAGAPSGLTPLPVGGHQDKGLQVFNPEGTHHKWAVHAHLLFDNVHDFPNDIVSNNIGYGGDGLFDETYAYRTKGHSMPDERQAHLAVLGVGNAPNAFDIAGSAYDLFGHNCQCYTMEVFNMYNTIGGLLTTMLGNALLLFNAYLTGAPMQGHIANLVVSKRAFRAACAVPAGLHSDYHASVGAMRNLVLLGGHRNTAKVARLFRDVMNVL